MNLLALDTSTDTASVALWAKGALFSKSIASQQLHANCVLPLISEALEQAGLSLQQLDGISVGVGPGSFTGLRIACSIAKGLAYAHDLSVYPVNGLDAIAAAARMQPECADLPLLVVLDARMQEVYWAYFPAGVLHATARVSPAEAIDIPEPVVLAGLGFEAYMAGFRESTRSRIRFTCEAYPTASALIHLVQGGHVQAVNARDVEPVYVRNNVTQGAKHGQ